MDNEPTSQPEFTPVPPSAPVAPLPTPTYPSGAVSSSAAPPVVSTAPTDTGLAPNVAAGLSVTLGLITGIVFLVVEKRNQFVRYWAMQATFFGAAALIFSIASSMIAAVLGHVLEPLTMLWELIALVVNLGFLIVWIMLIKSFSGQEWDIPVLGKPARQQLNKPPVI